MSRTAVCVYTLVVALLLLDVPRSAAPDGLDVAWQGLLQHDWNTGARFGVESVFTFGPAGFLFGGGVLFDREGMWAGFAAALIKALGTSVALTALAGRLPRPAWRAGYLFCLPVLAMFGFGSDVFTCL
ncbi:MAG TPA: hypothetical protein VFA35_03965, partial [Burkholderiaceae bacterium]|nr:hypothetical protein [Burkholderiaceae bacterium]